MNEKVEWCEHCGSQLSRRASKEVTFRWKLKRWDGKEKRVVARVKVECEGVICPGCIRRAVQNGDID